MAKLPRDLPAEQAIRAFVRAGFVIDHQTGSHVIMYHSTDSQRMLSVPRHRNLKTGTLRTLIRLSRLTIEEFMEVL